MRQLILITVILLACSGGLRAFVFQSNNAKPSAQLMVKDRDKAWRDSIAKANAGMKPSSTLSSGKTRTPSNAPSGAVSSGSKAKEKGQQ